MVKQLTSRVNGLAMISSRADFKTKLMVANGIVLSKLCYLVQLWGGCEGYLLQSLQVQLNKAARHVTGMSNFTPTRKLMKVCGWLTVKQLVKYHTILMVHKAVITNKPMYISSRLKTEYSYSTRMSSSGGVRMDETYRYRTDLPMKSFRYRGAHDYNAIPADLRKITNLKTFKVELKKWIKNTMNSD